MPSLLTRVKRMVDWFSAFSLRKGAIPAQTGDARRFPGQFNYSNSLAKYFGTGKSQELGDEKAYSIARRPSIIMGGEF